MDMMTTIGLPKELYGALLDAAVLTSIETRKLWNPSNGAWLCRWLASDAPGDATRTAYSVWETIN